MRRSDRAHDSSAAPAGDLAVVTDALLGGAVVLEQPARGYRVNVDTLLLAAFAVEGCPHPRRVLDLGAGVGALGLVHSRLSRPSDLALLERDPSLCALSRRNLARAEQRGTVHQVDLERDGVPPALHRTADVVLCNPPFYPPGRTRAAPDPGRRHARSGPLDPFLLAARDGMAARARAFFAYPAPALAEALQAARAANLVVKRLRHVHAFSTSPARLLLLELRQARPGGLVVMPPLVEWVKPGVATEELRRVTGAPPDAPPPTRP